MNPDVAAALADDVATLALLHDAEIVPAVMAELVAIGFPGNLALVPHGPVGESAWATAGSAIRAYSAGLGSGALDALAADFAGIYLSHALGASPCESYWLSDDHLHCQSPMFDLRALYAVDGLAAENWRRRPDDHLVCQLQFLAHLLRKVNSAEDWRAIATFLDDHLLRWLPDFAGRVAARADTLFYSSLATLTDVWLQQFRDRVAERLGLERPSASEVAARLSSRAEAEPVPLHFMPGAAGPGW